MFIKVLSGTKVVDRAEVTQERADAIMANMRVTIPVLKSMHRHGFEDRITVIMEEDNVTTILGAWQ